MRQHVFFRDEGYCAVCHKKWPNLTGAWEADHIVPLMLAFGDLSFWEPENVQLLCKKPCHEAKSADDMRKYGGVLDIAKKNASRKA